MINDVQRWKLSQLRLGFFCLASLSFHLLGEYLSLPPPNYLKPSDHNDSYIKTLARTLLLECILSTLKTALKVEQNMWKYENCRYLENGQIYGKILKISVLGVTLRFSTRIYYWF